ncbi:IgGFc_binding domain-containing protein [Caenorhabditis elegans]|uniref:IgGFc_binding domain-containing protein n=3 Tax=Caenorhabditis elegans TaxID=6239 RepID=O61874_CAEEL|nr:IgGFc_binding domain-containing protein [Caenorhabditis elegans]CCD74357.1 IgGFc_binding domain-containing protein [Caenorhabditis elegans]|eukprot:NP_503193.1 Downstream Of DAF-16 (regulated by DAF-16) [Caenorhabditis elegans]
MKFLSILFTVSALFMCGSAQQLMSLKNFEGMSVHNDLNVDAPYNFYVSADSDDANVLQQISVVTESGQKTLLELKNNLQGYGEITPFPVLQSAYLITALSNDVLEKLTGVIYLSSTKQRADNNFHVYGVSAPQNIQLLGLGNVNTTILFLNTYMSSNPVYSSTISQWHQNPNAVAFLYAGVPWDSIELKKTQIFSNPMHTDKADLYFANVEKFSISLPAFYLKTYRGVNFKIEPGYTSIDSTTTTNVTTTGFYMKPMGTVSSTITVNIKRDTRYPGASGVNVRGYVPTGGKVTVGFYNGASKYEQSAPPNEFLSAWSIPYIAPMFKVSSTSSNSLAEQYFVQYFVAQGAMNGGTTSKPGQPTVPQPTLPGPTLPYPTVPGRIQTTTKSSGAVQLFVSVTISMMLWL